MTFERMKRPYDRRGDLKVFNTYLLNTVKSLTLLNPKDKRGHNIIISLRALTT